MLLNDTEVLCTVLPGMAHSSSTNVALVRSVGSLLRGRFLESPETSGLFRVS